MIVDIVKAKIPVIVDDNYKIEEIECEFFLGVLTLKFLKEKYNVEIQDIAKKSTEYRKKPIEATTFMIDVLYECHVSARTLIGKSAQFKKDQLWIMAEKNPVGIAEIIVQLMDNFTKEEAEEVNPKMPSNLNG